MSASPASSTTPATPARSALSIADGPWQQVVERIKRLTPAVAAIDADAAKILTAAVQRLERPEAMVSFAGLFSVGKSSVINFGIGRKLIPTLDLADTAVPFYVRRSERDSITVYARDGRRRAIPCQTDAISQEASLTTPQGPANKRPESIDRLEIRLADFPSIGPACWVDTPGRNNGEESLHSLRAASQSDVMIWVLRSGQFLAEKDVESLAAHVRKHGPRSVVFLLNVFLNLKGPSDDPKAAWAKFTAQHLHPHLQRLEERLPAMHIPPTVSATICVLSAEEAMLARTQFGGDGFMRLMAQLDNPRSPMIRAARLGNASLRIGEAMHLLAPKLDAIRSDNRQRDESIRQRDRERAQRAGRFERAVTDAVEEYIAEFKRGARAAAESLTDEDTSTYTQRLNADLSERADAAIETLLDEIRDQCSAWHHAPPSEGEAGEIRRLLTPDDVTVHLPDNPISGKTVAATTAAGAAAGTLICPVVGTFFGAIGGALVGAFGSAAKAVEADKQQRKGAVKGAADSAVSEITGKQDEAVKRILRCCPPVRAAPISKPDTEAQAALENLLGQLGELHAVAERLAAGDKSR